LLDDGQLRRQLRDVFLGRHFIGDDDDPRVRRLQRRYEAWHASRGLAERII